MQSAGFAFVTVCAGLAGYGALEQVGLQDQREFIRTATRLCAVPAVPEIVIHAADEVTALWQMTEEALDRTGLAPPFWAFAWAGGQALARHILDNPEIVLGRTVLDVASGSGLVAIAAARAGAARVAANDIDPFALGAIALNATANGVSLDILSGDRVDTDAGWDVVLAGDVSYERDMAARLTTWFMALARRGAEVLIGDPGRSYLARDHLDLLATYEVPVPRALEDADVKGSSVWRFRSPAEEPHVDKPPTLMKAPFAPAEDRDAS